MESLEQLPDRVSALEGQILQFRGEMRGELSAIHAELKRLDNRMGELHETAIGHADQLHDVAMRRMDALHDKAMSRMDALHSLAMNRMEELHGVAISRMRDLHERAATEMRVLHEDVISRIALLGAGARRPARPRPRRKR